MNISDALKQRPSPGSQILAHRGDTLRFCLSLSESEPGKAWLRTNLGHAELRRKEIMDEVEKQRPILNRDWFDMPMRQSSSTQFEIELGLNETGHFEAKCFFLKEGDLQPVWPEGENVKIKIEPARACCGNIIYNAFIRQFGPNKVKKRELIQSEREEFEKLDEAGYTVIPPSGTFRDFISELDFIIGELGCRIVQLLPIHPTPTTYARMGRFGSPFASLSFTSVDPALAVFDPAATPLEQFIELVDAIHQRNGMVTLDIAINHTGWASELHGNHPSWLVRDDEGRIEVPGAWGVEWADLTRLDYSRKDLWRYMAGIFLTWCRRGIDGFRCDAGYMIPLPAWKYITAVVREQFPDTIFLLEGLGGKVSVTRELLGQGNLNWAYSELFQNYDRSQIEQYLPEALKISENEGVLVHFAETHDNPRLAAHSILYARMRTTLCALCSSQGGFGFANGVEWFATEKIDVHQSPSLNWGAGLNQVKEISRLSHLLKVHPAFSSQTELKLIQLGGGNNIALLRHHIPTGKRLIVAANLDEHCGTVCRWNAQAARLDGSSLIDLITGSGISLERDGELAACRLKPGEAVCLSADIEDLKSLDHPAVPHLEIPIGIVRQKLRAKAMEVVNWFKTTSDVTGIDFDQAADKLAENPFEFCRQQNPQSLESRVVSWQWPRDVKREVMIPPGFFTLVGSPDPFGIQLVEGHISDEIESSKVLVAEQSLPAKDGTYFCLIPPAPVPEHLRSLTLKITVFSKPKPTKAVAPILALTEGDNDQLRSVYRRQDALENDLTLLDTDGRGGMLHAQLDWSRLNSKYDALLAANLNPDMPEDRWIMWSRFRAWIVYQGFSQELNLNCLDYFEPDDRCAGRWHYRVPSGHGQTSNIALRLEMLEGKNAVRLTVSRKLQAGPDSMLPDDHPVRFILRPDIEDRNFHLLTKAYAGPEKEWPGQIIPADNAFVFTPHINRKLNMRISRGRFTLEPEWYYMINRPQEAERGMDPHSDLFSPGYFSDYLLGGESIEITAEVTGDSDSDPVQVAPADSDEDSQIELDDEMSAKKRDLAEALNRALDHYVVRRGDSKSVIAGYPWFLDWGRDSLIVCRGLIAAERFEDVKAALTLFGQYEENGTLPNMIHGHDIGNRDTSDAPLWFGVACRDLANRIGSDQVLDEKRPKRSFRDILISIGRAYRKGTSNGIAMDKDSGLIFSPSHFTWMDTNHPAGTPRQGYCIEIQALWFALLNYLSKIDAGDSEWKNLAQTVRRSISALFLTKEGCLSDCLHASPGTRAADAEADDAVRPNQLLALTLEAVDDKEIGMQILETCLELLVPGAIRSLADRPVKRPLPIHAGDQLLNNPYQPYQGRYIGDEDSRRKPAYHNGTAWTWIFPSFCEAWAMVYGKEGVPAARSWLASSIRLINGGCIGHVPEIIDGDYPHAMRGCDAQAWGVSELLRVWKALNAMNGS